MEYIYLSNGIAMPKMILGSFNVPNQVTMYDMVKTALSEGVTGFDTSPSYGNERLLGNALKQIGVSRSNLFLTDKIDVWQMYQGNGIVKKYVEDSLRELHTDYLDLLLVHWPYQKYLHNTWACFEKMYKEGIVRSIGICNLNTRTYFDFKNGEVNTLPHVVQIEISPLRTANTDLQTFINEGITVEAYSPLGRMVEEIRNNKALLDLTKKYDRSIAQIILRWHLERSVIPVFTSTKPIRIKENLEVFDFHLEQSDIEIITALNQNYKIFPESYGCPGY